jgi:hypothetical protein
MDRFLSAELLHSYRFLLWALAAVWGTHRVDDPLASLPMRNECPYANNRMIDVLRKFIAKFSTYLIIAFVNKIFAAAKPRRSGTVSMSQTMTFCIMINAI